MNDKYTFKKIITNNCIEVYVIYENEEILFNPKDIKRDREFSLMIGKGYNDLSISTANNQVVTFNGVNPSKLWIKTTLTIPDSKK